MTDAAIQGALSRFVFEHLAQPLVVLDDAGRVISSNRAASADPQLDPSAPFRGDRRDPDVVAFLEQLRATGQAQLELPAARAGSEQGMSQLRGVAIGGVFIITLESLPRPPQRDAELRRLRRLDTLGFITARVAHDINNLLTPLLLLSRDLVSDLEATGHNPSMALEIELAAQRAAGLLQSLLGFARHVPARTERVSLNTALIAIRPLLELMTGPGVQLSVSLDDSPPKLQVDRIQLEQSLMNLVSNAVHAMPDGGEIRISASRVCHQNGHHPAPDEYAVLTVSDDGCGMTPDVQQRAFDAFFTTRSAAGGTGLGLSSVQNFVKEHRGTISLDSAPGRGTRIAIHLPICESGHAAAPRPGAMKREPGGTCGANQS